MKARNNKRRLYEMKTYVYLDGRLKRNIFQFQMRRDHIKTCGEQTNPSNLSLKSKENERKVY